MKPFKEQRNVKTLFRILLPIFLLLFAKKSLTLSQVGQAMINAVNRGYEKKVLEVVDIKKLAS